MNAHKVCSPSTAYHRRNYVPSNTGIEAWGAPGISECALCGDRAKKEVSRVEWGYTGSAQSITVQGGQLNKKTPGMQELKGKAVWGLSETVVLWKPRREASEEAKPGNALVLDF